MPITAVRYLRRSKRKDAQERAADFNTVSVEDQRKRAKSLESSHGYAHLREFVDDGVSAWREDVERPGFEAMARFLESGEVDVVVADAPDRLSRQGGEAYLVFRRMCREYGVKIHTASNGLDDPEDDNAEIPAYLSGWAARKESQDKSRRLRNASAERAREGRGRAQGVTPFGWSPDDRSVLDPAQAAMIRAAKDAILRGGTIRGIARDWNKAGIVTSRGNAFTHAAISAMLTRPRNAGLVQHRREVLEGVTGEWEPLWDRQTHEALVQVLGSRALTQMTGSGGRRGYSATSLLSGTMRCACGGPMRLSRMTVQADLYRCDAKEQAPDQQHTAIRADLADEKAIRALVAVLMLMDADDLPDDPDSTTLAALHARRGEIAAAVTRLVDAVKVGALRPEDVSRDRADLEREAEQIAERIGEISRANASAALITDLRRTVWDGVPDAAEVGEIAIDLEARIRALDLEAQRALIAPYLEIKVHVGRGPERIQVTRKVATPSRLVSGSSAVTPTGLVALGQAEPTGSGSIGGIWVRLPDGRSLFAG